MGKLPGSFLAQERGFESREREFRRDMDSLHTSTHNELSLQVSPRSILPALCPDSNPGGTESGQAAVGCVEAATDCV